MRTYGYVPSGYITGQPVDGTTPTWVEATTDENGCNDLVYLTTLCQVLLLDRGEDPIYGGYGIPSLAALQNQVPPDLFVAQTQAQFAPFFASLAISRASGPDGAPIYNIAVVTNSGAILTLPGLTRPVIPT